MVEPALDGVRQGSAGRVHVGKRDARNGDQGLAGQVLVLDIRQRLELPWSGRLITPVARYRLVRLARVDPVFVEPVDTV